MATSVNGYAQQYITPYTLGNRWLLGGFLSYLGVTLENTLLQLLLLHLCGRTLMDSCYVDHRNVTNSNILTHAVG